MKEKPRNWGILSLILVVIVASAFIVFFAAGEGETRLYFNAESDLPDPMVYLKSRNDTGLPVHILDIGKTYNVVFTVACLEKKPGSYTYIVDSEISEKTKSFSLEPNDVRKVSLTISPTIKHKWVLNSSESSKIENSVDITENSWLAERREFTVIVREEGLPAIVEERYDLPISSSIESFGRVYHMNITLDELRSKPFERKHETKETREFEEIVRDESIKLSVENNQLHVVSTVESKQYISEPKSFRVRLVKENGGQKVAVNDTTGIEDTQEINFIYQIR